MHDIEGADDRPNLLGCRGQPEEHKKLLADVSLYAVIIFNAEWVFEFLTYGYNDFFADNWYKADTMVNVMNVGSYARDIGALSKPYSDFVPNVAFLRMLRMLKPLGRVEFLFPSKVVVKTVAAAMQSMGPVLSLVAFAMFFFGVAGIYIFGAKGELYFRCGVAMDTIDAFRYYDPRNYSFDLHRDMQVMDCTVDMDRYHEFLELRGRTVFGQGSVVPQGENQEVQEPAKNFSQAIETFANFSGNASATLLPSARRVLSSAIGKDAVAVQIYNEETGEYDTKQSTFQVKERVAEDEAACGQALGAHLNHKMEDIYIVDGVEMSAAEFRESAEFAGRYLWLGQPIPGEEDHRRARTTARSNNGEEGAEEQSIGFGNFREVKCIVAHPPKICT